MRIEFPKDLFIDDQEICAYILMEVEDYPRGGWEILDIVDSEIAPGFSILDQFDTEEKQNELIKKIDEDIQLAIERKQEELDLRDFHND